LTRCWESLNALTKGVVEFLVAWGGIWVCSDWSHAVANPDAEVRSWDRILYLSARLHLRIRIRTIGLVSNYIQFMCGRIKTKRQWNRECLTNWSETNCSLTFLLKVACSCDDRESLLLSVFSLFVRWLEIFTLQHLLARLSLN
jgi:hypothetical protein